MAGPDWLVPRDGLAGLAQRLRTAPLGIAYLGASVSAQRAGYRPLLHAWLVEHTGQAHRPIQAALGGIDALAGVFLMDRLVLRHRPALCFIEFSTGDAGRSLPSSLVGPAVEGMVKKLRALDCQVVFLHMFRADAADLEMDRIVDVYERVADHWGIPSLRLDRLITAQLDTGPMTQAELYRDGIHTTPAGAKRLVRAISDAWLPLTREKVCRFAAPPASLFPDCFDSTEIVPPRAEMLAQPLRANFKRFRLLWPYLELDRDHCLRFETSGTIAGIVVISGPESGMLELITPRGSRKYADWDRWCSWERLNAINFAEHFPGLQAVTMRVCAGPEGAAADPRLKLYGWMVRR